MPSERTEILFVALPATMGGSNRSLASIIKAFQPHVRCIVAGPENGPFREFCRERGIGHEYVALPSGSRVKRLIAAQQLVRWVFQRRRRLLSIHAQALTGLNIVAPAAFLARVPVVVRISDPESSRWGRVLGPLWRLIVSRLVVVPVSDVGLQVAVTNHLCRAEDGHVIPDPVDPADVVGPVRPKHDPVVIGYLANPTPRKGFDLLPEIVSKVSADVVWKLFSNVNVNGAVGAAIRDLSSNPRVEFPARQVDVRNIYAQVDIVFVPSRSESFSRVVAEAMLNGLPVVASNILPHRLLVGEDEAGLLFTNEDSVAAAAAIDTLATQADLRSQMGAVGRVRAKAYGPSEIAKRLMPLYGLPYEAPS